MLLVIKQLAIMTSLFFFFNDTATTEIYTLSLHDALPIFCRSASPIAAPSNHTQPSPTSSDRKSTRLNSSHVSISYAVFCLKKTKLMSIIHQLEPSILDGCPLRAGALLL